MNYYLSVCTPIFVCCICQSLGTESSLCPYNLAWHNKMIIYMAIKLWYAFAPFHYILSYQVVGACDGDGADV